MRKNIDMNAVDYDDDDFEKPSPEKKRTQKAPQGRIGSAATGKTQNVQSEVPVRAGIQASGKGQFQSDSKTGKTPLGAKQVQVNKPVPQQEDITDDKPTQIKDWGDIVAQNDTNKYIIMKFMRKGFTSLSAEELASTMVSPDFTSDFQKVTKENWVANYQFKVVERLNKCNFNLKWKTRPSGTSAGLGYMSNFFDLCKRGDTGGILKFFREKYKPDQEILEEIDPTNNKTGLHYAVEEGQVQVIEYLLKKGARVDSRDKLLRTPLHLACLKGHSVAAYHLVQAKCDTFERDISGRTAMHFAVCCGAVEAAQSLITILSRDSMDLVHMTDHAGRTPLHYAVFADVPKQIKIVEQLLMLGANVNAADQERRTPLHTAAEEGKANLIPILIQNGASPGLKDYQSNTPFELAKTEYIRELIIVNAPNANYRPTEDALAKLAIDGSRKKIQIVANLPQTDFYEPFEHAQPQRKRLPKINKKPEVIESGVEFVCSHQCQPAQVIPPEELCSHCRPLGPSNEWLKQKKTSLPYNIRNYQVKLIELLKRTQEFGVTSYQHVRKPYLFTGSWMEYVRTQEDLNLQITGCRQFESVMKIFNILFPYDKPLPVGFGDELGLAAAYSEGNQFDPNKDLKDCHPDKLRERLQRDTREAVTEAVKENRVEDINDLLTLQQQMTALVTANEMALVNIQTKDDEIGKLRLEIKELKAKAGLRSSDNVKVITLEEQIFQMQDVIDKLGMEKGQLQNRVDQLIDELENADQNASSSLELQKLKEQAFSLKKAKEGLEQQLLKEQERNMQLRMKAGEAFMAALDDPLLQSTGGKRKDAIYCPEDDNALVRLLQTIDRRGGANLEQLLLDAGDPNKYISIAQFDQLLKNLETLQTDYTPLQRIAGFFELEGNIKKIKISTIMERVYNRKAMRAEVEEQTLKHIAAYIEKREGMTIDKVFQMFDEGDKDGMLTESELIAGLQFIKINVNQQLKRILLAIFDHNKDGLISKDEFFEKVSKYATKAPITTDDIEGKFYTQKDKEDLVNMVNEERREKAVFENFAFDEDDADVMARRKAQMIDLIKNKKMPVEKIRGEVIIRLDNFANLPNIPGRDVMLCRLKQSYFDDNGVEQQRKGITKFIQSFNREEEKFDPPLRIKIMDLIDVNKNICWDIMTLQLFLNDTNGQDKASLQNAQFIGECYVKWKHCFLPEAKNNWQDQQVWLQDPENKATALRNGVTGQLNIATIYIEMGQSRSSFNTDGTLKQVQPKYGNFQAQEVKNDLRSQQSGSAGTLDVYPKNYALIEAEQTISQGQYAIRLQLNKGEQVTTDVGQVIEANKIKWIASSVVGVSDTQADQQLNVALVKVTPKGQSDVEVANGTVPVSLLQQIYSQNAAAFKPFAMDMTEKDGRKAKLLIKIEFKPTGGKQDAQEVKFDESKVQAQPTKMNVDDSTQRKAQITTSAVQGKVNQPAKADAEDLVQPIIKPVAMTSVNAPTKINIDVKAVEPDEDAWSPAAKLTLPQESLSQFAKSQKFQDFLKSDIPQITFNGKMLKRVQENGADQFVDEDLNTYDAALTLLPAKPQPSANKTQIQPTLADLKGKEQAKGPTATAGFKAKEEAKGPAVIKEEVKTDLPKKIDINMNAITEDIDDDFQ